MTSGALQPKTENILSQRIKLNWFQVFIRAVTMPSAANYRELLDDPQASQNRACTWVFLTSMLAAFISMVFSSAPTTMDPLEGYILILLKTLLYGLGAVTSLFIAASIWHATALMFSGDGTHGAMVYVAGAIQAPMIFIAFLVSQIPSPGLFLFLLFIYHFFLYINAIKAVYKLGTGKATLIFFMPVLVIGAFLFVIRVGRL